MNRQFTGRAILGLDLDGCCADYTAGLRPYAAEILECDASSLPEPETYNMIKAWNFPDKESFIRAHTNAVADGLYANMPVIAGAAEACRKMSAAGVHIRIVTHRLFTAGIHERVVADTAAWLERNGFPYMSLCFTGAKDSVGAHLYVEDSPNNIALMREYGWETWVVDQPYNRDVDGPRITDWAAGADAIIARMKELGEL